MAKFWFCVSELGCYALSVGCSVQMVYEYNLANYLMFVFTPN